MMDEERTERTPYKVVATKIATEEADKLDRIAQIQGLTKYDIIQNLVGSYIRLCDPGHVITQDMNKLRMAFEIEAKVKSRLNLTDPTKKIDVREATYFMGDNETEGMRLVHVFSPFMGEATMTENVSEILDITLRELSPVLYEKLMKQASMLDCKNVMELLLVIADEKDGIDDANEFERMFGDVRKNEFGREMADAPYRRTMNNSMSNFEAQMTKQAIYEEWERKHQTTIEFPE